jgi:hypothetical protein
MAATWLPILAPTRVAKLCLASTPARGLSLTHAGIRRDLALAACFARPLSEVEPHLVDRILSRRFREGHPEEVRRIERTVRAEPSTRTALIKHAVAGLRPRRASHGSSSSFERLAPASNQGARHTRPSKSGSKTSPSASAFRRTRASSASTVTPANSRWKCSAEAR